jgi:hypothetical protein
MRFRQTFFVGLLVLYLLIFLYNAIQKPDLYDYERITFIHRVVNAQWHAKVGLPFFIHPVYSTVCRIFDDISIFSLVVCLWSS